VELWEVEEVLVGDRRANRTREARYFVDGRTSGGRLLRVVFETDSIGREVDAFLVTAFPL